ncbi:MAG: hypothetical protein K2Y39_08400 [Candidatus Obscuribacterales bacterium]|nr:hypothetical protein [Candidatus Obscuribacterales bacterium]
MLLAVLLAVFLMLFPTEVHGKNSSNYFPREMEKSLSNYNVPLRLLSEPPLWRRPHGFPVYRLTFNRRVGFWETITFHAHARNPHIVVKFGNLIGVKRSRYTQNLALTSVAREKFLSEINSTGFWNSPTFSDILGTTPKTLRDDTLDAEPWIVEGVDKNRYHVVKRGWTRIDKCSQLKEIFYNQAKKFDVLKADDVR